MRTSIKHLHGPAPTPGELEAAIRNARQLRSEALHDYLAAARSGLGRTFLHLGSAFALHPAPANRPAIAPSRLRRQPFWSILPGSPRWMQALWSRRP
ncbi:MAG: hypothetical protein U5R46_07190 [Gammaproteobacteria bacterium]|nr:hypothetical protein [Gammaproteobacteria bacterium]